MRGVGLIWRRFNEALINDDPENVIEYYRVLMNDAGDSKSRAELSGLLGHAHAIYSNIRDMKSSINNHKVSAEKPLSHIAARNEEEEDDRELGESVESDIAAGIIGYCPNMCDATRLRRGQMDRVKDMIEFLRSETLPAEAISRSITATFMMWISAGAYRSLARDLVDVPIELYVPDEVQAAWCDGRSCEKANVMRCEFPADFGEEPINESAENTLLDVALPIGTIVNLIGRSLRQRRCLGLAFIQLIQTVRSDAILTMEKAAAVVGHWIRMYSPMAMLFPRGDRVQTIYIQRRGFMTPYIGTVGSRILSLVKCKISESSGPETAKAVMKATTFTEIYDITRGSVLLPVGRVSLLIRLGSSTSVDAVMIGKNFEAWHDAWGRLSSLWCRLLLRLKSPRTLRAAAEFSCDATEWLYSWMLLSPYVTDSDVIGAVMFHSLVCTYHGVEPTVVTLNPMYLRLEALLASDLTDFRKVIELDYSVIFKEKDFTGLPSVAITFPSYYHRHRSLRRVDQEQ